MLWGGEVFVVYILVSCVDGSLYTGQTQRLKERLLKHNRGFVRVTCGKAPWKLGYFEIFQTRREAMWREWELKRKYNTDRKKKMVAAFDQEAIKRILGL
ncbi:MAG TPA: GIY-YIG nuclease family protein [Bacteroidota bacterium]|nr:GIY-YIG nuclease family protein [Bacteroidota bacterium]